MTDTMKITRSNTQASCKAPAEYYTGNVRIDAPFSSTAVEPEAQPLRLSRAPARRGIHIRPSSSHPAAVGCRSKAGSREEARPGDIVVPTRCEALARCHGGNRHVAYWYL